MGPGVSSQFQGGYVGVGQRLCALKRILLSEKFASVFFKQDIYI